MTRYNPSFYPDLARAVEANTFASEAQHELDAGFHSFSQQATSLESIASFTAAGLIGKLARFGVLASGLGRASALHFAAHAASISAEAATFMGMSRVWGHDSSHASLREEFLSQFINFAGFRIFGAGLRSYNPVLQHFGQSLAMMGGHELAASLGYESHSNQSFFQKFLNANLSTLQISAGSALSAGLFGGKLQRLEHSLEVTGQIREARSRHRAQENLRALRLAMGAEETSAVADTEAPPALEDLEASILNPRNSLENLNSHFSRARTHFASIQDSLAPEIRADYDKEISRLQKRIRFWDEQNDVADRIRNKARQKTYHETILIGQRLLLDQVLTLSGAFHLEPINEAEASNWTLRTRLNIGLSRLRGPNGPLPPTRPPSLPPPRPGAVILEAAISQDSGLGPDLMLWPHQMEALQAIKANFLTLRNWKARFISGEETKPADIDMLQGTIALPVGGGKTRLMSAAFAQAIELGMFVENVDKFFIFNHTNSIHQQNSNEVRRLNAYFREKFGRDVRISEYKADNKDLSGDIVVLSIPTVQSEANRRTFRAELEKELSKSGVRGQVIAGAIDEIHHMADETGAGAETWLKLMETMREISPHFFRLGFTGSKSGREGRVIFEKKERDLLLSGITPRRYLMRVKGMDLSNIRVSVTGNFNTKQIKSALTMGPEAIERNTRIYEAMEEVNLVRTQLTPSGRAHFQPFLYFANMLEHAEFSAQQYAAHFQASSPRAINPNLRNRNVKVLGGSNGVIKRAEMEKAIAEYRAGIIDSIVCVISGETSNVNIMGREGQMVDMTRFILTELKDRENGVIEAGYTVDAITEGTDAKGVKQQVGANPRFSLRAKRQEAGRSNRRADGEITPAGELVSDPPCVLFDVIDTYMNASGRTLITYGNVVGAVRPKTAFGQLFDVIADAVVGNLDYSGRATPRPSAREQLEERLKPTPPPPRPPTGPRTVDPVSTTPNWVGMVELLREVLTRDYEDNIDLMARDLNITTDQVAQLLAGETWSKEAWFFRRLGLLLYQNGELFYDRYQEITGRGRTTRVVSDEMRSGFTGAVTGASTASEIRTRLADLSRSRPAEKEYFNFALTALENMYGDTPRLARTNLAANNSKNGFQNREQMLLEFEAAFRANLGEHGITENNFANLDEASCEFSSLAAEYRTERRRQSASTPLSVDDAQQALTNMGLAHPVMASYINDFALPIFKNTYAEPDAPRIPLADLPITWTSSKGRLKHGSPFLLARLREMFNDFGLAEKSEALGSARTQVHAILTRAKSELSGQTDARRLEILQGLAQQSPEYANYWRLVLAVVANQGRTPRGRRAALDIAREQNVQESDIHAVLQFLSRLSST